MITDTELLNHKINIYEKASKSLKKNHEWGQWDNWREFIQLDIKIMELKMELLAKEKQLLEQSLEDYKNY